MKKAIKKLRSKSGETLIESIAAILVFTLSSILFFSMVNAAANINITTKEADRAYYTQQVLAEAGTGAASDAQKKSGTVYVDCGGGTLYSHPITVVSKDGTLNTLYSYYTD